MKTVLQPPSLQIDKVLYASKKIPVHVRLERRVVWNLLAHLEQAGWLPLAVESDERVPTATAVAAMEELFNLDEGWLFVGKSKAEHGILIVFGNGCDCVSDYTFCRGDADGFDAVMRSFDAELFA